MIFLELFWSFFQIGLFSIGGGYAALPIIQNQIVNYRSWLTLAEFTELIVIAEMTPGPIALNSATFVGIQVAGLPGAIVATIGFITAPSIIVFTLAFFYFKYKELSVVKSILGMLRPAVVALIFSAAISIIILTFFKEQVVSFNVNSINYISIAIYVAAIVILRKFKLNPILVMIGCGVVGGLLYTLL